MRILDRYIAGWVLKASLLALLVLLAMFTFFAFLDEMGDVGRGSYGIWEAIQYMALTLPTRAFQILPVAALLGSLLGLGVLASSSELTVMRASGISLGRISVAVMRAGAVMMLLALAVGEGVAPVTEELAQQRRSLALADRITLQSGHGFWARDGLSYINIREVLSERRMSEVYIYELDADHRLRVATHARQARYEDGRWLLEDVRQSRLDEQGVQRTSVPRAQWSSPLVPEVINVATVSPERLAIWGLVKYIGYLEKNALDSAPYRLALWGKLMAPLATGIMVLLAVPFVFGPLRTVGMGQRVLVGALVGIGYHILSQTAVQVGLVYGLNPVLSAAGPTLLILVLTLVMMRRVR